MHYYFFLFCSARFLDTPTCQKECEWKLVVDIVKLWQKKVEKVLHNY